MSQRQASPDFLLSGGVLAPRKAPVVSLASIADDTSQPRFPPTADNSAIVLSLPSLGTKCLEFPMEFIDVD